MNKRVLLVVGSLLLTLISADLGGAVNASAASSNHQTELSLSLKPGESGSHTIVVNDKATRADQVAQIKLTGRNSARPSNANGAAPMNNAWCYSSIEEDNLFGQYLWKWETTIYFSYQGSIVYFSSINQVPLTAYFWSLDHSTYSHRGDGTSVLTAGSIGYFKANSDHEYGNLTYNITSINCNPGSSTGTW